MYNQFQKVDYEVVNRTPSIFENLENATFMENADFGAFMIRCQNGELIPASKFGVRKPWPFSYSGKSVNSEYQLREDIAHRCIYDPEPVCSDKSDITPETCAWGCLGKYCVTSERAEGDELILRDPCVDAWPCPGEAKCIDRKNICDGVRDCGNGQDEDINLCTEEFCRNGFVSIDDNEVNYIPGTGLGHYSTDTTKLKKVYIFSKYRYPDAPHEIFGDPGNIANLQNHLSPKCNHSTKCLRRKTYGEPDLKAWIEC